MNFFRRLRRKLRAEHRLSIVRKCDGIRPDYVDAAESAQKRILIVKYDAIGDYILLRPVLGKLRSAEPYRNTHITLLGNSIFRSLAEALDADIIDAFLWMDFPKASQDMSYRKECISELSAQSYNQILVPVHTRDVLREHIVHAVPSAEKIAFGANSTEVFDRILPARKGVCFELDRNVEFFSQLAPDISWEELSPVISHELPPLSDVRTPYLVIFPGASAKLKRWDIRKFSEASRTMLEEYPHYTIYIAGSRDDTNRGQEIISHNSAFTGRIHNLCGKTSLPELYALIQHSAFVLTNDTVALHMAATTSVPFVCMLMGQDAGKFAPYPERFHIRGSFIFPPDVRNKIAAQDYSPLPYYPDINRITVEEVLSEVRHWIKA